MKSLFAKWKISSALDSGQPLPESLRQKIASDPELKRFANKTEALGRTLRDVQPSAPDIHNSIMRAVRGVARPQPERPTYMVQWLLASGAVAAVAAICVYWVVHRSRSVATQVLNEPVKVLEMSEGMPAFAMSPLSNEWARVDHDLQNTAQVLLASLP